MDAALFLGQSEKICGSTVQDVGHGKKKWDSTVRGEQNARLVYAVSFVSVSCVRSMVPPHPQPGPQQQQLKSRFTSVSQLLF
jgi:hypothetical protein